MHVAFVASHPCTVEALMSKAKTSAKHHLAHFIAGCLVLINKLRRFANIQDCNKGTHS